MVAVENDDGAPDSVVTVETLALPVAECESVSAVEKEVVYEGELVGIVEERVSPALVYCDVEPVEVGRNVMVEPWLVVVDHHRR